MSEVIGSIKVIGEEKEFGVVDFLAMKHENREVHVVKCEDGTIGIHTTRVSEDGENVHTGYRFSRETFSMLTGAMVMAAHGWNIDIEGFMSMMANGSDEIEVNFSPQSKAWDNIISKSGD